MVTIALLDKFAYNTAALVSTGGLAAYHCYFTGKESLNQYNEMNRQIEAVEESFFFQVYYNIIWESGQIWTNLRSMKYLLINHINLN